MDLARAVEAVVVDTVIVEAIAVNVLLIVLLSAVSVVVIVAVVMVQHLDLIVVSVLLIAVVSVVDVMLGLVGLNHVLKMIVDHVVVKVKRQQAVHGMLTIMKRDQLNRNVFQVQENLISALNSITGGRGDASGVAGSLSARIEALM